MGDEFNEEAQFVTDEVSTIVRETVESVIAGAEFKDALVKEWTATILQNTINGLTALQKPFKYTVNCAIMQKAGAGFHTVSSCLWDIGTDGCCSVRWENKFITVIVSVFGFII